MYDKVEEMEKEFKKLYPEETVMITNIVDEENEIELWCCSGTKYKCTYNNGNIETTYEGAL